MLASYELHCSFDANEQAAAARLVSSKNWVEPVVSRLIRRKLKSKYFHSALGAASGGDMYEIKCIYKIQSFT